MLSKAKRSDFCIHSVIYLHAAPHLNVPSFWGPYADYWCNPAIPMNKIGSKDGNPEIDQGFLDSRTKCEHVTGSSGSGSKSRGLASVFHSATSALSSSGQSFSVWPMYEKFFLDAGPRGKSFSAFRQRGFWLVFFPNAPPLSAA
jgi:hypothetical protein